MTFEKMNETQVKLRMETGLCSISAIFSPLDDIPFTFCSIFACSNDQNYHAFTFHLEFYLLPYYMFF